MKSFKVLLNKPQAVQQHSLKYMAMYLAGFPITLPLLLLPIKVFALSFKGTVVVCARRLYSPHQLHKLVACCFDCF